MAFSAGAAGGAGATLESTGGARGLAGRRARSAGRYPRGGENLLGPDSADKLPAAVGEESTRSAEVWDYVAHEGFADRAGGVIGRRDKDSILGIAIHKNDQEFMAVVRRQRSHNVNGQRIPGTLRLDSASRFLAMSVLGAHLTLGTARNGI